MMDDYIRRSDALELICSECVRDSATSKHCGVSCYEYEKMKMLPAADVKEVVHGEWIENRTEFICSACRERVKDEIVYMVQGEILNFCPNCGADMRGEQDV